MSFYSRKLKEHTWVNITWHIYPLHSVLLETNISATTNIWQAKLTKREPHSWDPRQRTTWSRLVTSDFNSV